MLARMIKHYLIAGFSALSLLSTVNALAEKPLSADVGYVSLKNYTSVSSQVNPIRLSALQETATTLGARGALAWRSYEINESLKQQASYLDQVFDFNQLLIGNNVLPPVLVEANSPVNLSSSTSIRLASKIYEISAPATFVTAAPTWRTYLWMNFKKPEMPDQTLLPQTQAEAIVWNKYIKIGWEQGLSQANSIFSANLSRLKRDYTGIVLYRKLLAQGMVSAPFVAQADMGVTGDDNQLRINDRVLRITEGSKLQTNPKKWAPVLTK